MLGRELESPRLGLIAALLIALSPSEIWYAQEARTYSLLQISLCVALLGLARYLANPKSWSSAFYVCPRRRFSPSTAMITALVFVLACNLAFIGLSSGKNRHFTLKTWFVGWWRNLAFILVALHSSSTSRIKLTPSASAG